MSWNHISRKSLTIYIVIAICLAGSAPAQTTVYVDGSVATTGDGTLAAPFKTIAEALARTDAYLTVLVAGRRNLTRASHPAVSSGKEDQSTPPVSTRGRARRQLGSALLRLMATGGAFCVGLAPYAYVPWAARRLPPVNWENAQSWEAFSRLVLATRYRHNLLEASPAGRRSSRPSCCWPGAAPSPHRPAHR